MTQKKSLDISMRTIALKTLETNLSRCREEGYFNNWQRIREVVRISKNSIPTIIPIGINNHIPIDYFIDFFKSVPLELWCDNPVFYYNIDKLCWDALGFLGEKIHRSNVRTKYLQLCFDKVGLDINDTLNNEEPMFLKHKNNKTRFIAALKYLKDNLSKNELIQLLSKAKKLSDERYVTNS